MATITEPQQELHLLVQNRRTQAYGFFWGSLVLFLFSLWFFAKPTPSVLAITVLLLAIIALLGANYQLFVQGGKGELAQRVAKLRSERRLFGMILVAVGALLFLAAAWLGMAQKLEAFGETLSLAVFAIISLGTGLRQVANLQALPDWIMQGLGRNRKPVGIGLLLFGGSLVVLALWLRMRVEADFPFWGGALLLGLIAAGTGLYLQLAAEVNTRILVLVSGGLMGLVIAVMALGRAWLWRDEVFFGGLPAWRGQGAWRLWLCAYLELFGLALMFGSLFLARADIRANVVLRRALFGYNAVFTGLLLLAFLVVLNIVVYAAYPLTFDWSASRGLYTLSDSTKHILDRLTEKTTVYVFLSPNYPFYKDVRILLDNCQATTDKLKVDYISPDRDWQKFYSLSKRYPELMADVQTGLPMDRGLLVAYGPEPDSPDAKQPPHAFIAARKLAEEKGGMQRKTQTFAFNGEKVLMMELLFLMEGEKKSKIYFLQGHGEFNVREGFPHRRGRVDVPMNLLGMNLLVERLKKENYEVQGLSFGQGKDDDLMRFVEPSGKEKRKDVPADEKSIVVIAGPSLPVPKETLDALGRYMEKNGRLVVLLDVVVDRKYATMKSAGLEEFLKKYNVQVSNDYVLRYPHSLRDDPTVLVASAPPDSELLLAKKFTSTEFYVETVRVIRPGREAPAYRAEPLLEIYPREEFQQELFWSESNPRGLFDPTRFILEAKESGQLKSKLKDTHLPVAVAVKDSEDRPRLVVFGDAEIASNASIAGGFRGVDFGNIYFNLLASTFDWLADRPGVGARPKEANVYALNPTVAKTRLVVLPGWLMSFVIMVLGLGMWVVRRR